MPRHPPPEPDLTRVWALLARAHSPGPGEHNARRAEAEASHGWVPHGWNLPELTDEEECENEAWFSGVPDPGKGKGRDEVRAAGAVDGRTTRGARRTRHTGDARDAGNTRDTGDARDIGDARDAGGRHRRTAAERPRIVTLPTTLRGARLRVSWRAVVAFAVVLACAVAVFAVRVAWAEQSSTPQAVPRSGAADATGVAVARSVPAAFASSTTGPVATATGAAPSRRLVVDVVGQVAHPGIVLVDDGSRVVDVLTAAGGALPEADLRRLNLARAVSDGEQVFVPRPGESPPQTLGPVGVTGVGGGSGTAGSSNGSTAVVDLNTADLGALDGLPGVGPVLAQRIFDWRRQHGRFSTVDELGEVSGIGDKLLQQLRPRVRV